MKEGIAEMKNTPYNGYLGPSLPKEVQKKRLERALHHELTPLQRETILAYYVLQKNIPTIARERGVNKSTVCRTLQRGEARLRRCLRY